MPIDTFRINTGGPQMENMSKMSKASKTNLTRDTQPKVKNNQVAQATTGLENELFV
jgi:hypothetical protein